METLFQLADQLAGSFRPAAQRSHSLFINEIPADLDLGANRECLAHVISGMLQTVLNHSSHATIRMRAHRQNDVTIFCMKGVSPFALSGPELAQTSQLAGCLGGNLYLSGSPGDNLHFSFCYPNAGNWPG
ncbi:hypothetical protein [Terrimonas ferruginea]|uniref:hypothetical protein n=1 Tax=Terrimonas ferruginea TaxID=249 RepID=UPI000410076C|nr:hypothetical protein [Terrimonas ferruginea]